MNFSYKLYKNLLKIEDQEEAVKKHIWSYSFALANIPGSDFKVLQVKACESPCWAYCFAKNIPGANVKYCQEHACKNPKWAFCFARDISGADIQYCQEYACKNPDWALDFAIYI